ncbi:MAG: hypothetical protein ABIV63_02340 [Caldimonas sp.]
MSQLTTMTPSGRWVATWLDAVVGGRVAISQRRATTIAQHGGGPDAVKALAVERGVHLVQLADSEGDVPVAASLSPSRSSAEPA